MATPGALAHIDPDQLVERIANGEIPNRIAIELGVHRSTVHRALHAHPAYDEARVIGMHARLDEAELMLHECDERNIPRAREVWRAVTWRAERELSRIWGQRSQMEIEIIDRSQDLQRAQERIIGSGSIAAPQLPAVQHDDSVP